MKKILQKINRLDPEAQGVLLIAVATAVLLTIGVGAMIYDNVHGITSGLF